MSFEDDNKPGRGAYTPPTDDDLPFRRNSYDPRSGRNVGSGGGKAPPVTLIISVVVLILIAMLVAWLYGQSGLRASTDAPPAVGQPVGEMKTAAPIDAQPIDPAEGVRVYRDETETTDAPVTFTPPPEAPQPRPAAPPTAAPTGQGLPPANTATPATPAPRPTTPAPAPVAAPATKAPAATGGSASVQIGAFSSTEIADREYAAVAGRFGAYASGAEKRVTEVTSSSGSTLYRTAFSGLSRERAVAFCNALKAAGRDCIVR
nr:SPOR domain-containing protein [uncultured Brevundimonas sp.]